MSTITRADVSAIGQTIDRALRHLRHSRQLSAARQRGDTVAQLEHSLHLCDTKIGMAKCPSEADHWRSMHRQVSELIEEAGFCWRGSRLIDPAGPRTMAKAKSFGVSAAVAERRMEAAPETQTEFIDAEEPIRSLAKSFGTAARASEYNELRSEVMHSMAKARADGDFESRQQLITLRDQLTAQAAKEGLRLDSGFRFVTARA